MKCPKCHRDMIKRKQDTNYYYYECTHCHYTIGKKEDTESVKDSAEGIEH